MPQHQWKLTIRLFSVISGHSLEGRGLTPLQRCSRCILQPQPTWQYICNVNERKFNRQLLCHYKFFFDGPCLFLVDSSDGNTNYMMKSTNIVIYEIYIRSVTANVLYCSFEVNEFESHALFYVYFQTTTLAKVMNPLIPLTFNFGLYNIHACLLQG